MLRFFMDMTKVNTSKSKNVFLEPMQTDKCTLIESSLDKTMAYNDNHTPMQTVANKIDDCAVVCPVECFDFEQGIPFKIHIIFTGR